MRSATVLMQERRYDEAEQSYVVARDIWSKRYGAHLFVRRSARAASLR